MADFDIIFVWIAETSNANLYKVILAEEVIIKVFVQRGIKKVQKYNDTKYNDKKLI